jgi:hypothetical protein
MTSQTYTVDLAHASFVIAAEDSDTAVNLALAQENVGFDDFKAVWIDAPITEVSGKYGAPMGRTNNALDHDGTFKATVVVLDEGYDEGGAYWGERFGSERLYVVQDGMGNRAFYDAISEENAIEKALS